MERGGLTNKLINSLGNDQKEWKIKKDVDYNSDNVDFFVESKILQTSVLVDLVLLVT